MLRGEHSQRFREEAICFLKKANLRAFARSFNEKQESEEAICRHLQSLPSYAFDDAVQLFLKAKSGSLVRSIVMPSEWKPQNPGRFGMGSVKGSQLYHRLASLQDSGSINTTLANLEIVIEKVELCLKEQYVQDSSLSLFNNQKAELLFKRQKFYDLRVLLDELYLHEEVYAVIGDWIRYELVRLFNAITNNAHLNPHTYKEEFNKLQNEADELQKWVADDFIYQLALPFVKDQIKDEKPKDAAHKVLTATNWDHILLHDVVSVLRKQKIPVMQNSFSQAETLSDVTRDFREDKEDYRERLTVSNQRALSLVKTSIANRLKNLGSEITLEPLNSFEAFCECRHPRLDLSEVIQTKKEDAAIEQAASVIRAHDFDAPDEAFISMDSERKERWIKAGAVIGVIVGFAVACTGFGLVVLAVVVGCVAGALAGGLSGYGIAKMVECMFGSDDKTISSSQTPQTVEAIETPVSRERGLDQFYKTQSLSSNQSPPVLDSKKTGDRKPHVVTQPHSGQRVTPNTPRI